ncbi:tRNA (cytidine(34)-2'-O)-methyltransferase [Spiroplasma endosymbiont of Aspidapion aeneum]|uniref:tRNA (cytidine(34)-2'-O)-methyltransferase n=1 Tax=Spiroplasma endosymbiont of Aspidapion aeneum TaxID=3066276 RepID=UPI00313CF366
MSKINIVLYEPEIAENVGSTMRTCFLTNSKLHIIEPTGFIFDHRFLARSSANTHKHCEYELYDDWQSFCQKNENGKFFYLTRYGNKPISDFDLKEVKEDIFFIFGRESTGIPKDILIDNIDNCFRIPMVTEGRSLNISNCVAIVVYEGLRQYDYLDLCKFETQKGKDYLKK